jgi:Coenzyme PQQ synthesis protein D (PqqD)
MQKMPHARRAGLIVKEAEGEVLIYDLERNQAHCLNDTAARVWNHCDGETTVANACISLSRELGSPCDQKLVWYALKQFAKDNLLEESIELPAFMIGGMNRRQMVRALGLGAVIAVPLVSTILAPTPAQAATQFPPSTPCTSPIQCTSGLCACPAPAPGCVTVCQ